MNSSTSATPRAAANSGRPAGVTDHTLAVDHWDRIENWFSVSDVDGDAATLYQFYDGGSAAGSGQFWTPSGGYQPDNTTLTVAPADLHNVWVGGATATGTETMYIRSFDGTDWSTWGAFDFTAQPNAPPVATLGDFLLFPNTWAQVTAFGGPSYSDPDGDPAVLYQFVDTGNEPGGARLWSTDGGFQTAGTILSVAAADIGNVYVGGGPDSPNNEHMYVRAYDGTDWGAWDLFDVRGHLP